ncbi:hypothetical protein GCM10009779_49780 [Polymorphospora rubra]|uniref:Uncharacterized protein n=1 Tax=Polymorphospora rubra TaxID=338584 RepID=A0A810N4I1_9ACTN|nr:hypothetical protein Prubr_54130 [Polymorphospora rubra]
MSADTTRTRPDVLFHGSDLLVPGVDPGDRNDAGRNDAGRNDASAMRSDITAPPAAPPKAHAGAYPLFGPSCPVGRGRPDMTHNIDM